MKGIIALDIDGTLTDQLHSLPAEVTSFLDNLAQQDWNLIFITGRPFQWSYPILQSLQCSYHLAVQNGAIILKMPEKKIKLKQYLHANILTQMDRICKGEPSNYVIYSGYDHGDLCYFRPTLFDPFLLKSLFQRVNKLEEKWISLNSFNALPIQDWASVKCFGQIDSAVRMATRIENELHLHAPVIRDPIEADFYVVQATHLDVDKGKTVKAFIKIIGEPPIIIAAGDDNNDVSMLSVADIKIVMQNAPFHLIQMADIIAPRASEKGIIIGLSEALRRASERNNRD